MAEELIGPKTALVLSGGAPTAPLIAGALCKLYEERKTFTMIYTAGAGALMGLLFVAPKGKTPDRALRDIVEVGVSDAIYKFFPVGYKTFFKSGPFTPLYRQWAELFKLNNLPFPLGPTPRVSGAPEGDRVEDQLKRFVNYWTHLEEDKWERFYNDWIRLYNDWIDLWFMTMTPTDLNYFSTGLFANSPFIEELIDFRKLRDDFKGQFYMSAYNLTDNQMDTFEKCKITADHYRAALAYPFIYPPHRVDNKLYVEGAALEPLNFGQDNKPTDLESKLTDDSIDDVVIIDIVGNLKDFILREPRNLWDAFSISIMTPAVSLAEKHKKFFEDSLTKGDRKYNLHPIKFDIPEELRPHLLEWSYSNLAQLWKIGYQAGEDFCKDNGHLLPNR
jgi:predicted acylesterase/phospholipase RssA